MALTRAKLRRKTRVGLPDRRGPANRHCCPSRSRWPQMRKRDFRRNRRMRRCTGLRDDEPARSTTAGLTRLQGDARWQLRLPPCFTPSSCTTLLRKIAKGAGSSGTGSFGRSRGLASVGSRSRPTGGAAKLHLMNDHSGGFETSSTLTCPKCGYQSKHLMPTNACQFYYDCEGCGVLLKPLAGHCCVYCSCGDVKCPPVQQAEACCSSFT